MRLYPCGYIAVGMQVRAVRPGECAPARPELVAIGRSLSRLMRARERSVLAMKFAAHFKLTSLTCLGPCVIERVLVGDTILYPSELEGNDHALFLVRERLIEPMFSLGVELRCMPELFMFEADEPDALLQPSFVDAKGNRYD